MLSKTASHSVSVLQGLSFRHQMIRNTAAALLATGITAGLFHIMERAIAADYVEPDDPTIYTLEPITPLQQKPNEPRKGATKPTKRDVSFAPPPPAKLRIEKTAINLPTFGGFGEAPASVPTGAKTLSIVAPVVIGRDDVLPLRPPVPPYPSRAIARGLEGTCEVRLDVDQTGQPFNVTANCSDPVFERPSVRAVQRVSFAPKIVNGRPVVRKNVVYPLTYTLPEE